MTSPRLILFVVASMMLSSCTTSVQAPSNIGSVKISDGNSAVPSGGANEAESQNASEAEMEMEGVVSKGCVEAWRKALKGDEKGSMSQLNDLGKRYPGVTTITFMKGEVMEHLGKKKEAVEFYKQSVGAKEFSMLHIFKLAEALRKTGQNKDAIVQYKRLVKIQPDFAPGHLGLGSSLLALDKNSTEGKEELSLVIASAKTEMDTDPKTAELSLEGVVQAQPDNKEAKDLLEKLKNSGVTQTTGQPSTVQ
jgi:tetratricopeptide (TPR) repeat protein